MDPASFSIADDISSFTGPQGVDISASVTGAAWSSADTVLTIYFDAQSAPGFYRMVLGPDILDTSGEHLDQDNDLTPGEPFEDQYAVIFEIIDEIPGGVTTVFSADMSTDPQAALDSGWGWGIPAQGSLGGPYSAYSGSRVLGYNLNGAYEPGILRKATLPAFSTAGATQVQLNFRRWLGVSLKDNGSPNSRHADYARVEFSTNGTTWTQLWQNATAITDTGWSSQSYTLPATADNQANLRIRFVIESDGQNESFGWNIDDITVTANVPAQTSPPPPPVVICHTPSLQTSNAQSAIFMEFSQPMNQGSFSLADVAQFDGPNGAIPANGYLWLSTTLLRIDFPEQSAEGTYSMVLSPTIQDTYGQLIDQDRDLVAGEPVADRYTAAFTIGNAPSLSPPESWRLNFFGTTLNTGNAADDFDFDRDGLVNLMERAMGTNPVETALAYRPVQSTTVVADSHYLTFEYRRLANGAESGASQYAVDDLTYVVEYSETLGASSWTPASATVVSRNTVNGVETVVVRLNSPVSPGTRQFIRLNVTSSN